MKYNIPAGTQPGSTFRLREQGIQRLNANGKGDLLVTVNIEVPKHLSDEQRKILEQFSETLGENEDSRTTKKNGFNRTNGTKK